MTLPSARERVLRDALVADVAHVKRVLVGRQHDAVRPAALRRLHRRADRHGRRRRDPVEAGVRVGEVDVVVATHNDVVGLAGGRDRGARIPGRRVEDHDAVWTALNGGDDPVLVVDGEAVGAARGHEDRRDDRGRHQLPDPLVRAGGVVGEEQRPRPDAPDPDGALDEREVLLGRRVDRVDRADAGQRVAERLPLRADPLRGAAVRDDGAAGTGSCRSCPRSRSCHPGPRRPRSRPSRPGPRSCRPFRRSRSCPLHPSFRRRRSFPPFPSRPRCRSFPRRPRCLPLLPSLRSRSCPRRRSCRRYRSSRRRRWCRLRRSFRPRPSLRPRSPRRRCCSCRRRSPARRLQQSRSRRRAPSEARSSWKTLAEPAAGVNSLPRHRCLALETQVGSRQDALLPTRQGG